jgi:signal transduction histidine kinase/DNA-binding response OmpR family regulator
MTPSSHAPAGPDFRVLFESAPGLYLVLTPEFEIVAVSDAYLRATMTERQQILGRNIFEVFPDNPDDAEATGVRNLKASLLRALETQQSDTMAVQKYDIRRPEPDGGFEERFWSPVNCPVPGPDGKVAYLIHRVEDVTEFLRLKQAGIEREKMAESLRNRAQQMDAEVYRRAQEVAESNRQLQTANGELARLYERIAELMSQAADQIPTGAAADRDLAQSPISPEEMLAQVGQLIAGHKQLEENLRQAVKMEAVGRLAGGIAHDFNNLLTVILGHCNILLGRMAVDDPAYRRLTEIRAAGERAATLTQQILAFSRKQVLQPRVVNLARTLQDMDRMLRRVLGEDVQVDTAVAGELGQVKVDPNQVEQVLMNLVVNARDAMPQGGRLRLELKNVDVEANSLSFHDVPPGPYVMLLVTDTGMGMTTEVQKRVFEPFFTTKQPGKGTGLGLATVYGIVKQSGGHVWLYSELGLGTTFKIFFPRVVGVAEAAPVENAQETSGGHESILVVEDDDRVRSLVVEVLESAGYTVIAASGGNEAIAHFERHGQEIQLLITDLVLPKMSGKEIAERLLSKQPGLRILFISGYTGDILANQGILSGPRMDFLQKPFGLKALRAKVRAVLDASDSTTPRKVLVVDDEPAVRETLAALLKESGFEVHTAEGGQEARTVIRSVPIDLMLTDLVMPTEEGIELIRDLRKRHPRLKIVAMSGAFGAEVLDAAQRLGADAALAKPISAETLRSCVERLTARP